MRLIFLLCISFSIIALSCKPGHQYEILSDTKYEKSKETLAETEQKNPARFLIAAGNFKKNFMGQTVVKGTIANNAKIVSFKDVDIKLSFYSKTRTLLEEEHEVVYETVHPGERKNFKSKYFSPKGTDSVAMNVVSAKY